MSGDEVYVKRERVTAPQMREAGIAFGKKIALLIPMEPSA